MASRVTKPVTLKLIRVSRGARMWFTFKDKHGGVACADWRGCFSPGFSVGRRENRLDLDLGGLASGTA